MALFTGKVESDSISPGMPFYTPALRVDSSRCLIVSLYGFEGVDAYDIDFEVNLVHGEQDAPGWVLMHDSSRHVEIPSGEITHHFEDLVPGTYVRMVVNKVRNLESGYFTLSASTGHDRALFPAPKPGDPDPTPDPKPVYKTISPLDRFTRYDLVAGKVYTTPVRVGTSSSAIVRLSDFTPTGEVPVGTRSFDVTLQHNPLIRLVPGMAPAHDDKGWVTLQNAGMRDVDSSDQEIKVTGLPSGEGWIRAVFSFNGYGLVQPYYESTLFESIESPAVSVVEPGEPGGPGGPEEPGEPGEPGGPEEPGEPGGPQEPEEPGEPGEPGGPEEPGEPGGPEEPEEPVEPVVPVDPTEPASERSISEGLVTRSGLVNGDRVIYSDVLRIGLPRTATLSFFDFSSPTTAHASSPTFQASLEYIANPKKSLPPPHDDPEWTPVEGVHQIERVNLEVDDQLKVRNLRGSAAGTGWLRAVFRKQSGFSSLKPPHYESVGYQLVTHDWADYDRVRSNGGMISRANLSPWSPPNRSDGDMFSEAVTIGSKREAKLHIHSFAPLFSKADDKTFSVRLQMHIDHSRGSDDPPGINDRWEDVPGSEVKNVRGVNSSFVLHNTALRLSTVTGLGWVRAVFSGPKPTTDTPHYDRFFYNLTSEDGDVLVLPDLSDFDPAKASNPDGAVQGPIIHGTWRKEDLEQGDQKHHSVPVYVGTNGFVYAHMYDFIDDAGSTVQPRFDWLIEKYTGGNWVPVTGTLQRNAGESVRRTASSGGLSKGQFVRVVVRGPTDSTRPLYDSVSYRLNVK